MLYHFYLLHVTREEEGRKKIKSLQKQIQNVRVEREEEIQQRNQMIAHLKDQLQEMKAKTSMEGKYIQKDAEVAVGQTQKRCMLSEKDAKEEIEVSKIIYTQTDSHYIRYTAATAVRSTTSSTSEGYCLMCAWKVRYYTYSLTCCHVLW